MWKNGNPNPNSNPNAHINSNPQPNLNPNSNPNPNFNPHTKHNPNSKPNPNSNPNPNLGHIFTGIRRLNPDNFMRKKRRRLVNRFLSCLLGYIRLDFLTLTLTLTLALTLTEWLWNRKRLRAPGRVNNQKWIDLVSTRKTSLIKTATKTWLSSLR